MVQTKSAQGEMDQQMEDYEERRKELRSEANSTRMVLVAQGSLNMGGRGEDSPDNASANPKGPEGGQERAMRAGVFGDSRSSVRTTHRGSAPETYTRDNIGFRLAMTAQ